MADWVADLPVGASASFTKTIGEVDVTLFAGLTGDLHPVHIDEELMRKTPYGHRLVHGVFVLGLMSTAGARLTGSLPVPTVSIGYDRVRFLRPVFIGDTLTATYRIVEHQADRARVVSEVRCVNQQGEEVAAATHLMKVLV